jgi:hypothetical protein
VLRRMYEPKLEEAGVHQGKEHCEEFDSVTVVMGFSLMGYNVLKSAECPKHRFISAQCSRR